MAFDGSGNLYVADCNSNVVREFNIQTGNPMTVFGSGNTTYNLGDLNQPQGVAVDGQGNVYVWDRSNSRVEVFNPMGQALRYWGEGSENIYQMKFDSNGFLWETTIPTRRFMCTT